MLSTKMISRFLQFVSVSFFCVVILCTLCTVRSGDTHLVQRSFVYKEDALPSLSESLVPTKTSFAAKREASTWAKAVETGLGLLCKLKQKDEDGKLASQFTTLEQFNQYWTDPGYAEEGDLTTTGEDIQPALDALNLPSKLGERGLTGIRCMQSEEWFVNGVRNNPTGGQYQNTYSTEAGYISAEQNFGPAYMSQRYDPPKRAPPLNKLSDVLFINWQSSAKGEDISNLKYFFRLHIKNDLTKARIKDAAGEVIPRWPGTSFGMNQEEGQALLGTPNGLGVAYFLIEHKKQLNVKIPTKVTVFSTPSPSEGDEDYVHLLFYIDDVDSNQLTE